MQQWLDKSCGFNALVVQQHGSSDQEDCLLRPGHAAAVRCRAFLQEALEGEGENDKALLCFANGKTVEYFLHLTLWDCPCRCRKNPRCFFFFAETIAGMQAKAYWQHTGEIVSSRRAEKPLTALGVSVERNIMSCKATTTSLNFNILNAFFCSVFLSCFFVVGFLMNITVSP